MDDSANKKGCPPPFDRTTGSDLETAKSEGGAQVDGEHRTLTCEGTGDEKNEATDKPRLAKKLNDDWSFRSLAGQTTSSLSDLINEHILIARYGAITSMSLLALYGVSKTPLFFRYRSVDDIPAMYFTNRRVLHGRIVHATQGKTGQVECGHNSNDIEEPITLLVKNMSPFGRLMNRAAFDFAMKHGPTAKPLLQDRRDLLKIEIAGVKAPPYYRSPPRLEQQGEWLQRLAENRTRVQCQLISRRVPISSAFKGGDLVGDTYHGLDWGQQQTAICFVKYRPGMKLLLKDISESLVLYGRAAVASGIHVEDPLMPTVDGSKEINDLSSDAEYLERLGKAEFDAVLNSRGMWIDKEVRESRPDLLEEAEESTLQRLWKWAKYFKTP